MCSFVIKPWSMPNLNMSTGINIFQLPSSLFFFPIHFVSDVVCKLNTFDCFNPFSLIFFRCFLHSSFCGGLSEGFVFNGNFLIHVALLATSQSVMSKLGLFDIKVFCTWFFLFVCLFWLKRYIFFPTVHVVLQWPFICV